MLDLSVCPCVDDTKCFDLCVFVVNQRESQESCSLVIRCS